MKGKLLKAILVMCLCFVPSFGVSAADSDTSISSSPNSYKVDSSIDSKGRVIMSSFRTFAVGSNNMSQTTGYIECDEDACVYGVRSSKTDKYRISLYSSGGNAYVYITESIIFDESGSSTHIDTYNPAYLQSTVTSSGASVGGVGSTSRYDHGEFATRLFIGIPIFNSNDDNFKENVQKYLDSGDVSGAENEYDISQPDQDDSVELPKNLRSYGKIGYIDFNTDSTMFGLANGTITYLWDLPSDFNNYSYDVRVKVDYKIKDGSTKSTNWYNAVTDYPYERNSQYDLNTGEPVKRDPSIAEDYRLNRDIMTKFDWQGVDMTKILSFHVEIRNRCGNKCSNWVSIESQMDGSNSTSVKDDNGNVVEDDNYHATNTDNSDDSKYYDSDPKNNSSYIGNNSNISATSFIQYIRDGFGLLGSGGLIALMAGLFSFIPGTIWTLVKAGIAAGIMIMLISLTVSAVSSIISTLGGK